MDDHLKEPEQTGHPMRNQRLSRILQTLSDRLLEAPPRAVLPLCLALVLLVAAVDFKIQSNISVGLFYVIPILISALSLNWWQILILSLVCSVLREHLAPYGWEPHAITRVFSGVATFAGAGILARELVRGRRMALQYSRELKEQHERRIEAENQVRMLVESSPAAIITVDAQGRVDLANQAAHEMLDLPAGSLSGRSISEFLPTVANLLQAADSALPYRSATNCRGRRASGETFLACVWFATYPTAAGRRLAAIITDASEDLRDWQETSLQSLLRSSRVLVGSVSHEIRNMCAAIAVVHANLGRLPGVAGTEDYAALSTLAQALARLTTVELQSASEQPMERVSLEHLLDEFRIVVSPTLELSEVELSMPDQEGLPTVQGDRHGFLQVLLNLSRNSIRAMEGMESKQITVRVEDLADHVLLRFTDSGPGVADPSKLFQPFQPGAEAVGLGLFVSRAIVRACGGELYHEPSARGCTICIRLIPFPGSESQTEERTTEIPA
jgi:PAS domain S-box-containing protein